MLDLATSNGRIIAAALKAASEAPWSDVTLPDIAKAAGVSLVDLRRAFDSKGEILAAFVRSIDDEVLAREADLTPGQSERDALFEVIMRRFDALAPHKSALKSISEAWFLDPALMRAVAASQAWMLRAAGISAEGLEGQARAAGLLGVYASVFRTWLADEDPGLARTMAALDRRLRRGERALSALEEMRSRVRDLAGMLAAKRSAAKEGATDASAPQTPPSASA